MFKIKRIIAVFLSVFMCVGFVACTNQENAVENHTEKTVEAKSSIVFFETDNDADCALISSNGVNIMIDTGEKKDAKSIFKELESLEIDKIDLLIISHFDKDHIGGALKLLDKIEVKSILHPQYVKDSEEVEKLFEKISENSIEERAVTEKETLSFNEIKLDFIPAEKKNYLEKTSNNSSLVVKAKVENVTALFTGDCQEERVDELLASNDDLSADILKLMYHGREVKNENKLIERINPRYTVVTGKDSKKTRKNVEALNFGDVFYNQNGTVVFEINGSNITVCEY